MPSGIVEELFIAPPIGGGNPEVWFRNWSVVANLGLRAAGTLAENPESVTWGQTKDKFVVRTGTTTATQKYYIFVIPRSTVIFGEGVIPSVTLLRTLTPYTDATSLGTVIVDFSETTNLGVGINGATVVTVANVPPCTATSAAPTLTGLLEAPKTVQTLSITGTILMSTVLTAASAVTYGLDDSGALVLLIVGTVPDFSDTGTKSVFSVTSPCPGAVSQVDTSPTLTVSPRSGERHLWVVRIPGLSGGTVLFDTVAGPLTLTQFITTGGIALQERDAVTYAGAAPCFGTAGCSNLIGSGTQIGTLNVGSLGNRNTSGYSVRNDSLWDTSLPFVSGNQYATSSTTVNQVSFDNHSPPTTYTTVFWRWDFNWDEITYTQDVPWTYRVLAAYPLQLTNPINFLLVVRRNKGSTREYGLFLKTDVDWKTILDFEAERTGFVDFKVLTANEWHALWYIEADTSTVYLTSLRNNRTRAVGTNLAQIRNYLFRLIPGDIDDPVDLLWQGSEPAGIFLDGWEPDGTPTLTDTGAGFPLHILDPFADLAALPSGVSAPVLPTG